MRLRDHTGFETRYVSSEFDIVITFKPRIMKKILSLVAVVAMFVASASAQWFVGGNLGFSAESSDYNQGNTQLSLLDTESDTKDYLFEFAPSFGYCFGDWEVGTELGFIQSLGKSNYDKLMSIESEKKRCGFYVAPYVRYYALGITDHIFMFVDLGLSWGFGHGVDVTIVEGEKEKMAYRDMDFEISFTPGIEWQITEHSSIDFYCDFLSLGYEQCTKNCAASTADLRNKKVTDYIHNHYFYFGVNSSSYSYALDSYNLLSVGYTYSF